MGYAVSDSSSDSGASPVTKNAIAQTCYAVRTYLYIVAVGRVLLGRQDLQGN